MDHLNYMARYMAQKPERPIRISDSAVPDSLCVSSDAGRDKAHCSLQRHRASNGSLDLAAASQSDSERSCLPFADP
jgi:hypothetical protein